MNQNLLPRCGDAANGVENGGQSGAVAADDRGLALLEQALDNPRRSFRTIRVAKFG